MALPANLTLSATASELTLTFPKRWLGSHPLTRLDLEDERRVWRTLGFNLALGEAA
jgi:hypothetical protein